MLFALEDVEMSPQRDHKKELKDLDPALRLSRSKSRRPSHQKPLKMSASKNPILVCENFVPYNMAPPMIEQSKEESVVYLLF